MKDLSPQTQRELDSHLKHIARILYSHTEPEKLESFESIEWELREQLLTKVTPEISHFFSQKVKATPRINNEE